MRCRICLLILFLAVLAASGCRDAGIIAEGGDFTLTVEQLRFEVTKLGPSSQYDGGYESRREVVLNLAARSYLADEAERRGYADEQLDQIIADAEKQAVAEAYRKWKIENSIMLPRIKTKDWIEKLDRRLHLVDLTFYVYPVAEEAIRDLRSGVPISEIKEAAAEREDIQYDDMGWIIWKDLQREIADIVFRLDVGAPSEIVPGNDGYHVFYLLDDEQFGISIQLLSARSRRFVKGMEEERLGRELREELTAKYDIDFPVEGLARGLKAFAIAFAGDRPPDSLMDAVIVDYPAGKVTVGDIYSMYYATPESSRPYLGDYHSLSDFSLRLIMPELEAMAGYEMGLDRSREVRFAARTAREEALIPLMEDYFRSQVEITQQDIEDYYRERKDDLFEPAGYHAARILVSSMTAARQAQRRILAGADFAEVAREFSEDEHSAKIGGDMGWITEGLVAPYDSVIADMKPGDISPPFQTFSGIEILKLLEIKGRRYMDLEEATPNIKMFITNTTANELLSEFVMEKQEEYGFYINDDLIRSVTLPRPEYESQRIREAEPEEEEGEEAPSILPKVR